MSEAQRFYADCGEITLISTSIEGTLGQYLTVFLHLRRPESPFAHPDQLSHKNFSEKIVLLEKFCDGRKTDPERRDRLLRALRELKETRNRIAHWGASYDLGTGRFRLQDRKSRELPQAYLDASKAVEQVRESYFVAYRALAELYNEVFL